jgi:thiamine-monophosphate kinase
VPEFNVTLVGGDSSTAKSIFVDVAMVGRVRKGGAVRRSGATPGDSIYVSGTLGGSTRGLRLLRGGVRNDPAVERHLYPQPRHVHGASAGRVAHAMIDVSDGLSTDLGHILSESGVSARIYKDKLPAAPGASQDEVLHGGEEYELIVVLPGALEETLFTHIGEIIPSEGKHQILLVDGAIESVLEPQGWQHF